MIVVKNSELELHQICSLYSCVIISCTQYREHTSRLGQARAAASPLCSTVSKTMIIKNRAVVDLMSSILLNHLVILKLIFISKRKECVKPISL